MKNKISLFAFVALLVSVLAGISCSGGPGRGYEGPEPTWSILDITGEVFGKLPINTAGKIVSFNIRNLTPHEISDLEVHGLVAPFAFHGGAFPGVTGTCARVLAPASTCVIALEVSSFNTLGPLTRVVEINYRVGKWAKTNKATFKAEFFDSERLEVSNIDFGSVDVRHIGTQTLELRNLSSLQNIHNLVVTLNAGSGFTLINPNRCRMIGPTGTCKIDVEFSPIVNCDLNERVDISYEIGSQRKSEQVVFKGLGKDIDYIDLGNTQNFGSVTQNYNQKGQITLTLHRHASNSVAVNSISLDPAQLFSAGLQKNALASTCDGITLTAANSCKFVLDTVNPIRASTTKNDNIDIDYKLGTIDKKLRVTVNGRFSIDLPYVNGQNFKPAQVVSGGTHQVVLTVYNSPQSSVSAASNFAVTGLGMTNGVNLVRAATSTCGAGQLLSANKCDIVIDATPPSAQGSYAINRLITLTYQDTLGNNISEVITFQGSIDVASRHLTAAGQNFGAANVVAGASRQVSITITNPLGNSDATSFSVLGLGLTTNNVNLSRHASSTCPLTPAAGSVLAGNSCTIVIEARPQAQLGFYLVNQNITVTYGIGGQPNSLTIPLVGNVTVMAGGGGPPPPPPPPVAGAPLANFLTHGGTNFAPVNLYAGDSFDVTVTLTNGHPTASAKNFDLEWYDIAGIAKWAWFGSDIQLSYARSTCKAAGAALMLGQTCTMVLEITPDPSRPRNLGANGRKFKLKYADSNHAVHEEDFDLRGSWNFLVAPPPMVVVPTTPPQSLSNNAPPHLLDARVAADEYYLYSTRQQRVTPVANINPYNQYLSANYVQYYLPALWNLIPNRTFYNTANHMPWGFKPPAGTPRKDLTRLKDIVADRIVDPVTGVRYVKLYHGTTSDTLNVFQNGANIVAFNKAEIDALGQGWYLASSANDSKGYACDRYNDRKKAAIGPFYGILLVVGIEENDFIAGKESQEELSKGKSPPAWTGVPNYQNPGHYPQSEWGKPLDPAVYFRRNGGAHNQFVFFENVKPYLKIFEIVKLGTDFGLTNGTDDQDGAFTIPLGLAHRCNY